MAPARIGTLDGSDGVLLTGATGFVGMELLARYLENTDRPIYTLVRAEDQAAATERVEQKLFELFGDEASFPEDRIVAVPGDVEAPGLGLFADDRAVLAERVSEVVHAAASVSFELPLEDSRRINVEGTRQMLDFAQLCQPRGGLRGFSYISTAYVAGTHSGEFREEQLEVGQEFRNPYERSKFEAERLVRDRAGRLPIRIFRPSIVVGEAASGWTTSFNVLYAPLKAFVRGVLPVLPARRRTPVDVVPVDYVADAVFAISRRPADGLQTYHLVAGEQATTVGELVDLTAKELGRRKPLIVPLALYRRLLHPLLVRRSDDRRRRGLERMETFFPYFSMRVRYRDERAKSALAPTDVRLPRIERYFGRLLDFAQRTRWGRLKLSRRNALRAANGTERVTAVT
jgi:thioester reductase-like protein